MRTNEIAQLTNVHPNTVRLYEEWNYISPVPRQNNGYRLYSDIHLKQMQIARLAFRQEFIQNNLRKKATKIVQLSGKEKFDLALIKAQEYLTFLQVEYSFADQAIEMVEELLANDIQLNKDTFTHKEVANILHLTEDTLRNWERNGLYTIARCKQNRRIYTKDDLQKLLMIRILRSAHYSITSILNLFTNIETIEAKNDIRKLLENSEFKLDFLYVTDTLQTNLKKAMTDVESIIVILKTLN